MFLLSPTIKIDTAREHQGETPSTQQKTESPSTYPPQDEPNSPVRQPVLHIQTSFDNKGGSLPSSPHNVSSPVKSTGNDRGSGFLEVPGNGRNRKGSDSDDGSRSVSSQGDITAVSSNSTQADQGDAFQSHNDSIMDDDTALKPDAGMEDDFNVENNPFAFSPGQLSKMFDPKSLAAFYKLGGLAGLEKGLRTDRKHGLSTDERHLSGRVSFEEATRQDGKPADQDASAAPIAEAGQSGEPFQDRLRVFKDNRIPARKGKGLLQLMYIAMKDKVLILLSIAAVVSLAVGLYQTFSHDSGSSKDKRDLVAQLGFALRAEDSVGARADSGQNKEDEPKVEWVEGVAIVVAIAIVVLVSSLVDWRKERRFAKLNRKKQDRSIKVVRAGKTVEISVYDILAGDVVHLEPGDLVPADGVLIEGFNIKCDESQATGESDLIRKRPADEVYRAIQNHENLKKMDPFIQSGARVTEGIGTYLVTGTGVHSSYGKILIALNDDQDMTPLQHKLNVIAIWIAKLGIGAAALLFVVLFIKFCVNLPKQPPSVTPAQKGQQFLDIFLVIVTIIVVAVPEGLPLAVTLALAYAMVRMLKDNNLVRHLKACEVMGNATTICSDKTGTLTQNEMRVVSGTIGTGYSFGGGTPESGEDENGTDPAGEPSAVSAEDCVAKLDSSVQKLLLDSVALNSTAFESEENGQTKFIGSKTETALLLFAKDHLGMGPVAEEREKSQTIQLLPFDSARKAMGIVIQLSDKRVRLYVKGASEIVLSRCTDILDNPAEDISTAPRRKEDKDTISSLIDSYANRSLRTIAIAHRDFETWPPEKARRAEGNPNEVDVESLFEDLVFVGVVGIQDPLRAGVPESVALCQKAGVTVRMVTGDNKLTAQAIAKECGILQPDGLVMEGPEFRNLSRLQQEEIIPRLQVLARSSPEDKRILVQRLKDKDEIVAVTGDGTNDAPALSTADVGFSMGQSGTEVAKEASDIILMDDNFVSIVQALKWGRAVNDAVKRFLQFQLTVNVTAVMLTFITAVSHDEEQSVLSAVQLLWVNLIMDTLAALALATDPPRDSILERKPEPRKNFIITPTMWKMILGQAIYQLGITLLLYYGGPRGILPLDEQPSDAEISTLVFNTFVWMQIFNQWK